MIEWVVVALAAGASAVAVCWKRVAAQAPAAEGRSLEKGRFQRLEVEVLGPPPDLSEGGGGLGPAGKGTRAAHDPLTGDRFRHPLTAAPVIDGAVPVLEYAWAWHSVDEHLFQAIEHMTHESVQSIGDLGRAIDAHHWAAGSWGGVDSALVASVKGHLGEWLAADHLMQAGHAVAMPTASNQAGWDLLIDGHEVNVKTVGDAAAHLRDHFAAHPDVGVLLPHDAAHIPVDALHLDPSHVVDLAGAAHDGHMVLVDQALSNAETAHAAQSGLEVAAGHVDAHFPWITMAVSSFREGRLLFRGDTDLLRAARNVAVDTAAVGGGGALGMKAGAAFGTVIAPGVGTVIGAILGVVGGTILGRKAANAIKSQPLNEARAAYESAVEAYRSAESQVTAQATQEWRVFRASQKQALEVVAHRTEQKAREGIRAARQRLQQAMVLDCAHAMQLMDITRQVLANEEAEASAAYLAVPWWRRWLWPAPETAAARATWQQRRAFLKKWDMEHAKVAAKLRFRNEDFTPEIFDLALCVEQGEFVAKQYLTRVGMARAGAVAEAESARCQALATILKARKETLARLRARQQEIVDWVRGQMESVARTLEGAREQLKVELRKAGVPVEG